MRRLSYLATLTLAGTLIVPAPANAAPVRYEAETAPATCTGTIDTNWGGYSGSGFCNANNAIGAAAQVTVNAASAGTATLAIRYAHGSGVNRPADILVNGIVVQAASAFNATPAWDSWATKTLTVSVTAGANTIRLVPTTAGGLANIDYLDFEVGTPPAVPGEYQAENCTISQGVIESNHTGFTGTGFVNYDNAIGAYVQCTVTAVQAGPVALSLRYANGLAATRPMSIVVNGTSVATPAFGGTGAWTSWTEVTVNASLNAGSNTLRFAATTANGGPNLDRVRVTTSAPPTGTPVQVNGQLRVCGVKLCNQNNQPVQLRGMSTHGLQWYPQCVNDASLDALAGDWGADVIRLSMYIQEGGYETNPRLFTDRVHALIDEVSERGMYVIVDWHMLTPGDPNYNFSRASTFFTEIAQRHGNKVNILYEVANEPNGVSWSTIRSYHQQIIPVIRAQDANSVILLGTRAWSSLGLSDGATESEVISNPVSFGNIMYTFHFYAASHGTTYLNALSRAADQIPMFVTEFGTQTASGDGANDFTRAQQYLDLMASKQISWVNWNFSDDFRSGAVFTTGTCPGGPYAGTSRLKPAGVWIRDRIR
jgi:endoglucanase